jgi:hypothetical protein
MVNPYIIIRNPTMVNPYIIIRSPTMVNPYIIIRNPTMVNPHPICVHNPSDQMTKCNAADPTGMHFRMLDQAPWRPYYRNTNHR